LIYGRRGDADVGEGISLARVLASFELFSLAQRAVTIYLQIKTFSIPKGFLEESKFEHLLDYYLRIANRLSESSSSTNQLFQRPQ